MGILKDKTILYVTHQVEFLPAADLILVRKTQPDLLGAESPAHPPRRSSSNLCTCWWKNFQNR